ncbi:MAG: polysaccharide biosynthesis/export family protein [Reyranellaceae bacterium]
MHAKGTRTIGFEWRRLSLAVASVFAFLLAACSNNSGGKPLQFADDNAADYALSTGDYRIGSGEKLLITVFGQPELNREYQIDGAGRLAFPLVGTVKAAGMTPAALESLLADKLDPDYVRDANVTVEVMSFRPFYIVGEVRQPGSYQFVPGMTVLNAVALGGGYTYRARENAFLLRRPAGDGTVNHLLANADTPILPGDIVTVRERYF